MKSYLSKLFLLISVQTVIANNLIIKLGLIIDYQAEVSKGIRNDSWKQAIEQMNQMLSNKLIVDTEFIFDYDNFESEVEDDSKFCEKYLAIITCIPCSKTRSFYNLIYDFCPSTLILSIHESNCERPSKDFGIGFPIMTSVDDVVPMLVDMRNDFLKKWVHINIIHDNTIKAETLNELVKGLINIKGPGIHPTQITTFHFEPRLEFSNTKQTLSLSSSYDAYSKLESKSSMILSCEEIVEQIEKDEELQHFILLAKSSLIKEIIAKLHKRNLLIYPRKWLIIYSDIQLDYKYWKFMAPIFASTNTAIVQREISEYGHCDALKEGCQMKLAVEVFSEALQTLAVYNEYNIANFNTKPLTKNKIITEMRRILGNDLKLAQHCGNCDRFVLQAFEKVSSSKFKKKIITSSLFDYYLDYNKEKKNTNNDCDDDDKFHVLIKNNGQWTPFKGLVKEEEPMAYSNCNLKGKQVRVGIINQKPNVNVQILGKKCIVNGTTPELLALLAERINFTIKWVCWSDVSTIGTKQKDGSWDGILGKLLNQEIEIIGNGVWKTPSIIKSRQFEFLNPFSVDIISIVVKKTPEDSEFLFLTPFTYDTWICIAIVAILIGFILWKIHGATKYYSYYGLPDNREIFKLTDCILYCYGAMMQQGGDILPKAISSRILVAFWWLFVIVTFTTYSGNLVALLTFPQTIQPIQNAHDLKNSWNMKWGVSSYSSLAEMVQTAVSGELKLLQKGMRYYDFENEKEKIYEDIVNGDLGFLMNQHEASYWISNEFIKNKFCGMYMTNSAVYRTPIHLVTRKNLFPPAVIDRLNQQITMIAWSGLITYWQRWYGSSPNSCTHFLIIHAGDVKKIDLIHMTGAFNVLSWIIGLSIITLIGEIIYMKFWDKSKFKRKHTSTWKKINEVYNKFNSGMLYTNWVQINNHLVEPFKKTKLSFIHPHITAETDGYNKKWSEGIRPRAYPFIQDSYNLVYGNFANTIYNTPESYNYHQY